MLNPSLIFGFCLVIRKLHLVLSDFFIVEIGSIGTFECLQRLRKDICRVLFHIEDFGVFGYTRFCDTGGIREADRVVWLLYSTQGLRDHAYNRSVFKAKDRSGLEYTILAGCFGFDQNQVLDYIFNNTQFFNRHFRRHFDIRLLHDIVGLLVLCSQLTSSRTFVSFLPAFVIGATVTFHKHSCLFRGIQQGVVVTAATIATIRGGE